MFNLATKDVHCYWFDEHNAGLVASVFVSCVIDCLRKILSEKTLPIILCSDGCTSQNRNVVSANALLDLAMEYNVVITQKFLQKGYTQIECDSSHSAIECRLKNKDIYLPSQYATISKEARPKQPFMAKGLDTFLHALNKLASCINTAVNEGKNVTAANKRLISLAAKEIHKAGHIFGLLNPASIRSSPASNSELKEKILACLREEIAGVKNLVTANKPTYAQAAAVARGASAPTEPPSVSKPAIIITPAVEVKSRQDAVELFKKNINYRASNYAPAGSQPVSNSKLRVEFDNETQLKDTLTRPQGKSELKADQCGN
ncbi:unnamed protein product [Parnassius apollo]|uniref:(apollo) hypothetical protein n=1 Tax=Parnassius apollo TaxID=110799 RepID=A0A8S3VYG7_PARAO|nr:unnamed protein product [Parnassius apollo]